MTPFGLMSGPAMGGFGLMQPQDEVDKMEALRMALMQAGLGIMSARTGGNLGAAIGQGGLQGLQAYQQNIQGQKQEKRMAAKDAMDQAQFGMRQQQFESEQASAAADAERQKAVEAAINAAIIRDAQGNAVGIDQEKYKAAIAQTDPKTYARMVSEEKAANAGREGQIQSTDQGLIQFKDGQWVPLEIGGMRPKAPTMLQYDTELQSTLAYLKELQKGRGANVADLEKGVEGKIATSNSLLDNIKSAKEILKSGAATGSLGGAAVDAVTDAFGESTPGSLAADKLELISGWMVANVPRMEGPQSNFDVQNYQKMAAAVGDRTKPIKNRLAALEVLEALQKKYASLNKQRITPDMPLDLRLDGDADKAAEDALINKYLSQ